MKQWLMIENFTAFTTMYRITLGKQATHRAPNAAEKQLDYTLVDRKHIYCSRDAEANDMIHMGSDHRSVMAQFVIPAPKKEFSRKTHCDKKKMTTAWNTKTRSDEKIRSGEANQFEERYAELARKIKYKAQIAATTRTHEMTESTLKMRSGRIVAESEHEEVRLEVEAAAALHLNGDALAGSTEWESRDCTVCRKDK